MAIRPNSLDTVPGLIEDVQTLHKDMKEGDEETRHKLVIKTRSLLQSLLTPREQMIMHTWAEVCESHNIS